MALGGALFVNEKRWAGLQLGDVVCMVARTRRMIVVDMDLDDPGGVTCAWHVHPSGRQFERSYRTSALVFVARAKG